jgi:branched-chain amino acid transport system permease protein
MTGRDRGDSRLGERGAEKVDLAPRRVPVGQLARVVALAGFVYLAWYQSFDFTNVLMLGAIWAVAAVGLGLVLGSAGQMSLCQASFMLIGSYGYGALALDADWPTIPALLAGTLMAGGVGVLLSPIVRLRGYMLALGTIALSLLVQSAFKTGDWLPGGATGLVGIPPLELGGIVLDTQTENLWAASAILMALIVGLHLSYGRGARRRAIQFIHHDEELLAAFGRDSTDMKRRLFVVAGLIGGLAGGLYAAAFGFVRPESFGLPESFALALAVVIGGSGRLLGAALGAFIYQLSFSVLGSDLADYRFALMGVIVIATIHFFPTGLLPSFADLGDRIPLRRRRPPVERRDATPSTLADAESGGLSLRLVGVAKSFGALSAVDDLTAEVGSGELVALVGPNGAGKSTLLNLIAGEPVSGGSIFFGGTDVTGERPDRRARHGVGRTFQRVRLIPSLTVAENVMAGADKRAIDRPGTLDEAQRLASAEEAMRAVGMELRVHSTIVPLSLGERRLVEFARMVASGPRLALLDEPSSGLSPTEIDHLGQLLRGLNEAGCTVVLVEHNLPFVERIADRVIALDHGRLLADGPTAQVLGRREFQEAYVGATAA